MQKWTAHTRPNRNTQSSDFIKLLADYETWGFHIIENSDHSLLRYGVYEPPVSIPKAYNLLRSTGNQLRNYNIVNLKCLNYQILCSIP
jgi:hypothetical protein